VGSLLQMCWCGDAKRMIAVFGTSSIDIGHLGRCYKGQDEHRVGLVDLIVREDSIGCVDRLASLLTEP